MVNNLLTGLISYWKLDDTNDTDAVDAHSTNDGVQEGGITDGAAGIIGTSFSFDGVDGLAEIPDDASLEGMGALSISGWMKHEIATEVILGKAYSSNSWALMTDGANHASFRTWADSSDVTSLSTTGVSNGEWHHVVGVYDGSNQWVHVDGGNAEDVESQTGNIANSTSPACIGALNSGSSEIFFWTGSLDEIGIWGKALDQDDVDALYAAGSGLSYDSFDSGVAGTNAQINIGDAWKTVDAVKINIGDAWKVVASASVNIGDAWKTVF